MDEIRGRRLPIPAPEVLATMNTDELVALKASGSISVSEINTQLSNYKARVAAGQTLSPEDIEHRRRASYAKGKFESGLIALKAELAKRGVNARDDVTSSFASVRASLREANKFIAQLEDLFEKVAEYREYVEDETGPESDAPYEALIAAYEKVAGAHGDAVRVAA